IMTKTYRHGSGFYTDNLYRPVSQLMFATEWQLSPDNPELSHIVNVIFYALSCVLLFSLLRKLFNRYTRWIPLIITLLYAAHPIHTEVVANIKSRDEIISFLFILITIHSIILYIDKKKTGYLFSSFIGFLVALFSKESAITFLAVIPLTLYFFRKANLKEYILIMASIVIPTILYLLARQTVLSNYPSSQNFTVSIMDNYFYNSDLLTGWATAIMLLGRYLINLLVPYQQVCDYSYSQFPLTHFTDPSTLISLVIHLALLVYAIMGIRKKNPVAYGIFFYIITMSIFSNLLYRIGSSFADRFLFVPSLGFLIAAVFALFKILKIDISTEAPYTLKNHPIVTLALMVILLLYSGKTVARSAEWVDQFTLFGADVRKVPKSAHMHLYWGLALRDKGTEYEEKNKGETNWNKVQENDKHYYDSYWKAIAEFKKGAEIYPKYSDCYEQLGLLYDQIGVKSGNMAYRDTAEHYFLQSLKYLPTKATTNSNIAKIYYERGDVQTSKTYYLNAIKYDPIFSDGYFNLGSCYGKLEKYDSSFYYYQKCIELDPKRADAYSFMGLNYTNLGKLDSAIIFYDKAIALDPLLYSAYILKARTFLLLKEVDKAKKLTEEAISTNPFMAEGYLLLGQIEMIKQNTDTALKLFTRCSELAPNAANAYIEKYKIFENRRQIDSAQYYYNKVMQLKK
ncbi:MAG: tetratricopeptide repeat protein, partial [Bacteroidales bacterium]